MKDFVWWMGVVEDRDDPEKLGRCRVRIFGYHTDDKNLLPTSDLPWATPVQPITSASISGIGSTPVGVVPGAWVAGWFLDGKNAQQPVIFGTIPGKPEVTKEAKQKKKQDSEKVNVLRDNTGKPIYESSGNLIVKSAVTTSLRNSFDPLTPQDIDLLFNAIANKLSSNNLSKIGDNGELGKYQITIGALMSQGYLITPILEEEEDVTKTFIDSPIAWTGKNNIKSKKDFLSSTLIQEDVMLRLMKVNYDSLISLSKISEKDDKAVVSGFLASAYVFGVAGSNDFERKDVYGRQAKDFFTLGVTAAGGDTETVDIKYQEADNYLPEVNDGAVTNADLANTEGFKDPNKKYPKYEYQGLSDINKLAVSDKSHLSFKVKKAQRTEKIQLAVSSKVWNEPETPYRATYPHNQVFETEAGHVIELDSTPGAERIQVFHKKGTYIEIDVNGTMVRKVLGDNYEILDRNNFVFVKGAHNLTVEGKTLIYVKDDAAIEVDGDVSVVGHGDAVIRAAKNVAVAGKNLVLSGKDSVSIISEGPINIQSEKELNLKSKSGMSVEAGSSLSMKAGINLSMDALLIKSQMGANKVTDVPARNFPLPEARKPSKTNITPYTRKEHFDENFTYDAGEPEGADWNNYRESIGQISNDSDLQWVTPTAEGGFVKVGLSKEAGEALKQKSVNETLVQPVDCGICKSFTEFPQSFKLSKNFTIANLTVGSQGLRPIAAQYNLEAQDIVCNMMKLAENCLEPIRARFPGMVISSGVRRNDIPDGRGGFVKQLDHGIGGACDLVWPNRKQVDYLEITDWIIENVPFRQLLIEATTLKDKTTQIFSPQVDQLWIHIALLFDKNGKIVPVNMPVGQLINHGKGYFDPEYIDPKTKELYVDPKTGKTGKWVAVGATPGIPEWPNAKPKSSSGLTPL